MDWIKHLLEGIKEWASLMTPFGLAGGLLWKFWLKYRFDELRELYKKIGIISEEFRPNGGSTLRDAINRIEEKVTIQEQKTLAIIKSLPLGTWVSDERGKYIDTNRSLCKIIGRTESEIKGDNWSNWVHPDEKEEVFAEWKKCIENDINFDREYRFVLPDGKIRKVHSIAYQIRDSSGKLIGFLGTMSAIGESI